MTNRFDFGLIVKLEIRKVLVLAADERHLPLISVC